MNEDTPHSSKCGESIIKGGDIKGERMDSLSIGNMVG